MKCRIINGKKICRKSNLPWKMWGSWVGAVIGFILGFQNWLPSKVCNISHISGLCSGANELMWIGNIIWGIIFSIAGFLLGYVLTILYRRVFK